MLRTLVTPLRRATGARGPSLTSYVSHGCYGSLNKVILVGRVGQDPTFFSFDKEAEASPQSDAKKPQTAKNEQEPERAPKGLWSFSVATGRRIKKGEEWDTETTWHRVSAFTFADARLYASGQLGKGAQVLVEGRIRVRKDEESGRSYTDVVADKVDVIRPAAGPEDQH